MGIDPKNKSAVATKKQIVLTKTTPCALAEAQAVLSKQWGWTVSPIQGDVALYYQAFGVIRRGALDTNFDDDSIPMNFAATLPFAVLLGTHLILTNGAPLGHRTTSQLKAKEIRNAGATQTGRISPVVR